MEKNKVNIGLAIIVAAVLIAGAILIKGSKVPTAQAPAPTKEAATNPGPATFKAVSTTDHILGNPQAKIVMVEYADYQCPFCGKFFNETVEPIKKNYVDTGKIAFVYRDFAFLGEESIKSAEATECANDQGKYWEFHNYLFTHQNGENKGGFADKNLKSFAKTLGLNESQFNTCLDSGKYTQKIKDSTSEGGSVGVQGTPHSFILKDGKVVDEANGAYPLSEISAKIDAALK